MTTTFTEPRRRNRDYSLCRFGVLDCANQSRGPVAPGGRRRETTPTGCGPVTTEDVLVEVLTYFGGLGPDVRQTAARVTRAILEDPAVEVIPHTSDTFMEGLELYEARLDKSYSMVDCMSMQVMRNRALTEGKK